MPCKKIFILLLSALPLALVMTGCSTLGIQQPYNRDPLTGGVNTSQSRLLGIALPVGLQIYPSHSRIADGSRAEGLETLRGHVDQSACAMSFYERMKGAGWRLRLYQRFGQRAVYVYDRGNEMAALVFHEQGLLTIVEIWAGPRLADNAAAPQGAMQGEDYKQMPAEEYGPVTESQGSPAKVEKWGVEEREL